VTEPTGAPAPPATDDLAGPTGPDDLLPDVDALVASTAAGHHCPSIAWGLVIDGALAHTGATGTLDDGQPPDEHTRYRIASMTKSFTAAAVLALRDDGVLSLDDRIGQHAPELAGLAAPTADAAPIRIRHLLTMTAGFVTDNPWGDRHLDIDPEGLDAVVDGGIAFSGTTGSVFDYSNLGFGLLGRVVERATGRPVQDLVTERFLRPLGLQETTWTTPVRARWARPHRVRDGVAIPDGLEPLGDGGIAPMGGLWSTVGDVATWIAWLADAFPARDGSDSDPLSRASRREMQELHRFTATSSLPGRTAVNGYGYGLRIRTCPRMGRVVGHAGGLPGYGSHMRWAAGRGLGMVALSNVTYAPMTDLTQDVFELLLDRSAFPPPPPVDAPVVHELAQRLVALLGAWDDAVADDLFADNVALDEPYDRRRRQAAAWLEQCGGTFVVERVAPTTAAACRIELRRPGGEPLDLRVRLAPPLPPRIQWYGEHHHDH
jgi:CubicO group peptidase (beta-lactamase class C family)